MYAMDRNHPCPETNLRFQGSISELEKNCIRLKKITGFRACHLQTSLHLQRTHMRLILQANQIRTHANFSYYKKVYFLFILFGGEVWESKPIPNGLQRCVRSCNRQSYSFSVLFPSWFPPWNHPVSWSPQMLNSCVWAVLVLIFSREWQQHAEIQSSVWGVGKCFWHDCQ